MTPLEISQFTANWASIIFGCAAIYALIKKAETNPVTKKKSETQASVLKKAHRYGVMPFIKDTFKKIQEVYLWYTDDLPLKKIDWVHGCEPAFEKS